VLRCSFVHLVVVGTCKRCVMHDPFPLLLTGRPWRAFHLCNFKVTAAQSAGLHGVAMLRNGVCVALSEGVLSACKRACTKARSRRDRTIKHTIGSPVST
jgi:hypothetical protein